MTNLHAYTESGHDYPAYVSINRDEAGTHTITVRSRGDDGKNVGVIAVTREHLDAMVGDLLDALVCCAMKARPCVSGSRARTTNEA